MNKAQLNFIKEHFAFHPYVIDPYKCSEVTSIGTIAVVEKSELASVFGNEAAKYFEIGNTGKGTDVFLTIRDATKREAEEKLIIKES